MDLKELREKLDRIDKRIAELYEERMEVCEEVADYKIQAGKKVYDKEREQEKIAAMRALMHNDLNRSGIAELTGLMMSMSRKMQYQKIAKQGAAGRLPFIEIDAIDKENSRVVFQGAEGAYSQEAMFQYFGRDVHHFAVDSWRDAMIAIEEGSADYAVLPIENSTAGIVSEIYDLLAEYDNYIIGEQTIRIEHCLMVLPGTKEEEIRRVLSHPQSLLQSETFLEKHPNWQQISMKNNAFAVRKVREDNDKAQAAIAGASAAEAYGMEILHRGVNGLKDNATRFIIVSNQRVFLKNASRISICFEVRHEAGSLYHLMSNFIYNDLNMTRIESRPILDRNWEYRFFIDFEGNLGDGAVKSALRGLREEARNLRILGNY